MFRVSLEGETILFGEGQERGQVQLMNTRSKQPLITQGFDMTGPEWQDLTEIYNALLENPNPSEKLLAEFRRREKIAFASISPMIMRMRLEQELAGMFED